MSKLVLSMVAVAVAGVVGWAVLIGVAVLLTPAACGAAFLGAGWALSRLARGLTWLGRRLWHHSPAHNATALWGMVWPYLSDIAWGVRKWRDGKDFRWVRLPERRPAMCAAAHIDPAPAAAPLWQEPFNPATADDWRADAEWKSECWHTIECEMNDAGRWLSDPGPAIYPAPAAYPVATVGQRYPLAVYTPAEMAVNGRAHSVPATASAPEVTVATVEAVRTAPRGKGTPSRAKRGPTVMQLRGMVRDAVRDGRLPPLKKVNMLRGDDCRALLAEAALSAAG